MENNLKVMSTCWSRSFCDMYVCEKMAFTRLLGFVWNCHMQMSAVEDFMKSYFLNCETTMEMGWELIMNASA